MAYGSRPCPACGQLNRATDHFCTGCGTEISNVPVNLTLANRLVSTLPFDSFHPRRSDRELDGAGSGFLVMGLGLVIVGELMTHLRPLGPTLWATGVLSVAIGLFRIRYDWSALKKVGMLLSLAGIATLVTIAGQTFDEDQLPFGLGVSEPTAIAPLIEPTTTPDTPDDPDLAGDGLIANVPMFRGGPEHTGINPGPAPEGDPVELWRYDTAGEVFASSIIVENIVYLGTQSGFLVALEADTGQELWRYDLGNYIMRASPAVVDGELYIGAGFALHALDAQTGEALWRVPMRLAGTSSPVVVGDTVYIASQEGSIHAFAARDGKKEWEYKVEGLVFSSPAVTADGLYFGSDNGNVYGLSLDYGRQEWVFATGSPVFATPAVVNGVVYITSTNQMLYAISAKNGQEIWSFSTGGATSPTVVEDVVYVGSDESGIIALDAKTGVQRWLFATGAPVTSSPTVAGDVLVVGSGPTLWAISLDGKSLWRYPLGDTIESVPTVADHVIFVGSRDGYLYAIGGLGTSAATPAA